MNEFIKDILLYLFGFHHYDNGRCERYMIIRQDLYPPTSIRVVYSTYNSPDYSFSVNNKYVKIEKFIELLEKYG